MLVSIENCQKTPFPRSYRTLDPPHARNYPSVFGSFRLKHITTIVYNSPLVSRTAMQNDRLGRLSETELTLCSEQSLRLQCCNTHSWAFNEERTLKNTTSF